MLPGKTLGNPPHREETLVIRRHTTIDAYDKQAVRCGFDCRLEQRTGSLQVVHSLSKFCDVPAATYHPDRLTVVVRHDLAASVKHAYTAIHSDNTVFINEWRTRA